MGVTAPCSGHRNSRAEGAADTGTSCRGPWTGHTRAQADSGAPRGALCPRQAQEQLSEHPDGGLGKGMAMRRAGVCTASALTAPPALALALGPGLLGCVTLDDRLGPGSPSTPGGVTHGTGFLSHWPTELQPARSVARDPVVCPWNCPVTGRTGEGGDGKSRRRRASRAGRCDTPVSPGASADGTAGPPLPGAAASPLGGERLRGLSGSELSDQPPAQALQGF